MKPTLTPHDIYHEPRGLFEDTVGRVPRFLHVEEARVLLNAASWEPWVIKSVLAEPRSKLPFNVGKYLLNILPLPA